MTGIAQIEGKLYKEVVRQWPRLGINNGRTSTAAYAIERGVTRPSMPRILATFPFVAFFREFEVSRGFFLAAPFSSWSMNDSEDDGDIKILEYV